MTISKRVAAWCLYDWANSVYPAVILSFVFAPYFLDLVVGDDVRGTVLWTNAMTVSAIVIAFASPIVGAFGDNGGRRRLWLFLLSAVALAATAMMWEVRPSPDYILLALVLLVVSNTGFELAYVFYNSMLPDVAPRAQLGRVSGWGWGLGYFGSVTAIAGCYFFLIAPDPPPFGLDGESHEPIRATALVAALWFLVFMLPLVFFGPPDPAKDRPTAKIVKDGLRDLWGTIKGLRRAPNVAWYLVAHMVYIDGVNTLFIFGPLFAVGAFDFSTPEALLYGLVFYAAAGLGSVALGSLDDRVGSKPVILVSLFVITAIVLSMLVITDTLTFWLLSALLGFFIGPVQSVSRSLMARLSPEEVRTQYFGLYSLAGRATAPLGPALLGWIIATTESQRSGAIVIAGLTALGMLLLLRVREPEGHDERGVGAARASS